MDISSTEIRRRIKAGESISGMVPRAVEDFIRKEGLYA
jgi:nicotinate-nucleotide adenylyltransferase